MNTLYNLVKCRCFFIFLRSRKITKKFHFPCISSVCLSLKTEKVDNACYVGSVKNVIIMAYNGRNSISKCQIIVLVKTLPTLACYFFQMLEHYFSGTFVISYSPFFLLMILVQIVMLINNNIEISVKKSIDMKLSTCSVISVISSACPSKL